MIKRVCKTLLEYAEYFLKYPEEYDLPDLELKYFNVAGIAECIRMTLKYSYIPFENLIINKHCRLF